MLTKRGKLTFRTHDIKDILKSELAKELYGGKYATDNRVMPSDSSWNANQNTPLFIDFEFPALEITDFGNDYEYIFLGYEKGLEKKFAKFRSASLRQALQVYHNG